MVHCGGMEKRSFRIKVGVGAVLLLSAMDAVGEWGKTIPLCVAEEAQEFPVAVLKENGEAFVVWHDFRSPANERDLYGQRLNSQGNPLWETNGKPLVALPGSQGWPQIVDDSGGEGFFLLWGDSRNGGTDLYAQRFDGNGTPLWKENGIPVSVHAQGKDDYIAIPDGKGGFFAAWEDWRNGNQDIFGQHLNAQGEALWTPNGIPICEAPGHQYDPSIALDGVGGVVVTWWDVSPQRWRAMAQRMSENGKQLWQPEGVPLADSPANQSGPFVAGNEQGGAYIFWTDYRHDDGTFSDVDIYGQHLDAQGNRLWGDRGLPVARIGGNQQNPCVLADGQGGVYVAWLDSRDVFDDIYLQHFAPDGTKRWHPEGLPVCLAEGRQRDPHLVRDGDALWVLWYDYRRESENHTNQDLYAQRLDANGRLTTSPEGVPLYVAHGERAGLRFYSRGGRLLATWMEIRDDESNIYVWHSAEAR